MRNWIATIMLVAVSLAFVVPVFSGHGGAAAHAEAMRHGGAQGMAPLAGSMPMDDQAGVPADCCPGSDMKHRAGHGAACDLHCLLAIAVDCGFEPARHADFVAPAGDTATRIAPQFPFRPPIGA
tara:strand:+ start:3645 stop:4016 length:372 start_codon:yes stop_codon:yes gene_type:complete